MKKTILIIGSGGREHAIAKQIVTHTTDVTLFFAPGNGGTTAIGENLPLAVDNIDGIVIWVSEHTPDITIVGPEVPLSLGIVDRLQKIQAPVFGPSQKAAEIESSKSFAKAFMERHDIPTARYATFTEYEKAKIYVKNVPYPVVIKASGLAAGKGVIVPHDTQEALGALEQIMVNHEFGQAGDEVVIEERLEGEEVSLLAFSDGNTVSPMPPAQDHKRLLDGDIGPNTGGMGAYAPVPVCPPAMVQLITEHILQPCIDGLKKEGRPFVGVLYAGIMMTGEGPKVLEFNCRFGDPETEVILSLLDTSLFDIALACTQGKLKSMDIQWKKGSAICVVLASEGYPGKGKTGLPITGITQTKNIQNVCVYHAGTAKENDVIVTHGGRVLVVTSWSGDLVHAQKIVYKAIEKISFPGMQYRHDIGNKAIQV